MIGENDKVNDLFYTCSLIEYIARKTMNTKKYVVEKLGKEKIRKIYELASVYHSDISSCKYNVPSYFDIGKVYKRLIVMVSNNKEDRYVDILIEVLSSWIIDKIDNYNSSMYYENPSYIYACYEEGKVL